MNYNSFGSSSGFGFSAPMSSPPGSVYPPSGGYPPYSSPTPAVDPFPPYGAPQSYPSPYPQTTSSFLSNQPYPQSYPASSVPYSAPSQYPPSVGPTPYLPSTGPTPYLPQTGAMSYSPATGSASYPPSVPYTPSPLTAQYPPAPLLASVSECIPPPSSSGYPSTTYASPSAPLCQSSAPYSQNVPQYTEIPTLHPYRNFDPSGDASTLRKAMKGFGTDEAAIISILGRRTSYQRQLIQQKYTQCYGRDLLKDLKRELSGSFEAVVVALIAPIPVYLAMELRAAMHGMGTNERTLVEILCTRDNASIRQIKEAYLRQYNRKVEDDLRNETSGHFSRLLISMCAATRDESSNISQANELAQKLYSAGERRLGTNEVEFNRILSNYSFAVLRQTFEEYRRISGRDFGKALDAELSGDLKTGMKAIYQSITNRAAFFAEEMRHSMSGLGTRDRALVRLVVTRCEIDMGNIKQEYQRLYNRTLERDIQNETSGDYKKILATLVQG